MTYLTSVRKSLIVFLITAAAMLAQSGRGVVTGAVTDPSKAAVPRAEVTLTSTTTGLVRTSAANDAGIYYFGSMPVGPYHLSVSAPGFTTWETDFTLEAGQTITIDPAVTVGAVQSKVDVLGAASQISTEGSQISDIKTAKDIHDLPLNGRQISNLFSLTPGVEGGQNTEGAPSPRTNGMQVGSTDILLDGMSYLDRFGGGISRVQPGLDTIQEYRVETAGSGAAFDTPATVELVTRSGTNQFHGGLFETLRNNYGGLAARAVQDGNTPSKLIRNEFGGFVGGPIVKNKAFFFYDQELLRQRQEAFAEGGVPTAAMWGGDLSGLTDSNNDKYTLYNPYSTDANGIRTAFPNNKIPQNLLDTQLINALRSVTAVPTGPTAGQNPFIGPNFESYYPQNTDTNSITGRFDQAFSEKNLLYGRYTQSKFNFLQTGGNAGLPPPNVGDGTGSSLRSSNIYNIVAHYTHIFSPSLLNDLQLAAMRSANNQGTGADNVNWDTKLGLQNPFGANGWPTIGVNNYSIFQNGYQDADNHKAQDLTHYEIDDNATWVKGKHTFKFGFKGRSEYNNVEELQQPQGSNTFDGTWTSLYSPTNQAAVPFTGAGLADLELGLPNYLSNVYNRGFFYFQQKEIAFFGEDTWKLTPKLTVSAGLRWNYWTPYKEKYNRLENLDLKSLSPTSMQIVLPYNTTLNTIPGLPAGVINAYPARGLTAVSANSIGFPGALTPNVWTDFSPHIALAYRLTDKWVVRGGYSSFYYPMPLSDILQSMRNNAPLNLRYVDNLDSNNGANYVYSTSVVPAQSDKLPGIGGAATVSPTSVGSGPQSFLAMDVNHWNNDHYQEWTFTIERELPMNMILKLSYIGNHGSNLQQSWDENVPLSIYNYQSKTGLAAPPNSQLRQLDPNWSLSGLDGVLEHNGYSNSNSLQAVLEKRFSNGLSFNFSYVYTHAMGTNDPNGFSTSGGDGINAVSQGNTSAGSTGSVPANNEILGDPNLTDAQRLRLLYTNSSQVPPQRIIWNGVYQLPVGRGKKFLGNSNHVVDSLLGGWQIAFIGTWEGGFWEGNHPGDIQFRNPSLKSGQRLNLVYGGTNSKLWFAGYFDPTQATGVNLNTLEQLVPVNPGDRAIHPLGANFDNNLTQTLANGTVVSNNFLNGNLSLNARNFMLGPGNWNQDATLFKYFSFTERVRLRMSGDFFNVFNHPWLNNPDSSTGLINLSSQPNSPRIIQIGARLEF